MVIAPSKLGQFVGYPTGEYDELIRRLRDAGLVTESVTDEELKEVFEKARIEHDLQDDDVKCYNSPEERVRVFLDPYLSKKGRAWAVPLDSLDLPDE